VILQYDIELLHQHTTTSYLSAGLKIRSLVKQAVFRGITPTRAGPNLGNASTYFYSKQTVKLTYFSSDHKDINYFILYWEVLQSFIISPCITFGKKKKNKKIQEEKKEQYIVFQCNYFHLSPEIKEGEKYKLFSVYFHIILFSKACILRCIFNENFSKLRKQK